MSNKKVFTSKETALVQHLALVYGAGNVIDASVDVDNCVIFTDDGNTGNVFKTKLKDELNFFGPGNYKVSVYPESFVVEMVKNTKPADYELTIDEALGSADSNKTLAVIFRQQLKENNITEAMMVERAQQLLKQFPLKGFTEEGALEYIMARLTSDTMDWEAFTVGMKITGANQITIAIR